MRSKFPSQLLATVLIASLLGNQCLSAVHAHEDMGILEAAEHSNRPHVHLGSAHNHCHGSSWHSHGPAAAKAASDRLAQKSAGVFDVRCEHDADAFYVTSNVGTERSGARSGPGLAKEKLLIHCGDGCHRSIPGVAPNQQGSRPPPEIRRPACALYLLHLSIRC